MLDPAENYRLKRDSTPTRLIRFIFCEHLQAFKSAEWCARMGCTIMARSILSHHAKKWGHGLRVLHYLPHHTVQRLCLSVVC